MFGMVLQDTWLFGGTVADNVAYGKPDATREEIITACDEAYCDHFIRTLPQGYDTVVSEDSINISGGQKQRLSIARALARKPEILIFDDSFSALDYKTDATLREGLAKQLPGTTKIIVAQRISTIRNADQILVLDRGEIAGLGTHDELMVSCPVYREIAMSQLSEEELKKGGASK